jgi:hypothetical protein
MMKITGHASIKFTPRVQAASATPGIFDPSPTSSQISQFELKKKIDK